ncbi:hypothetical protein C5167_019026 [Papaver somniferum]|uniref:Xylanase inhibitor C-terminal domain-containing protein n=1 Tax=Papaver somniferum TaxID=3469 RepID=A0A4Y7ISD1_PAPSO|nr:hypothetical protein C5167_019026 [Papaver somniferum]
MNITRVASVKPFGVCFNSSTMVTSYPEGLVVPQVNLVLTNDEVWRVVGAKSSFKHVTDKKSGTWLKSYKEVKYRNNISWLIYLEHHVSANEGKQPHT